MTPRFFIVPIIMIFLLGLGLPKFSEAQTSVNNADTFFNALEDPTVITINLSNAINTRREDPDDSTVYIDFVPTDIDRTVTINSSTTSTIRYSSSATQTAEGDGVEFSLMIVAGGEIHFTNTANLSGGYSSNSLLAVNEGKLTFDKTATLINNKSTSRGGAIYAESGGTSILTFKEDAVFTSNSADMGGAVGLYESIMNVTGKVTFSENTAETDGGALWLESDATLTIGGNATFSKNSATGNNAGAIYANGGTLTFGGTFTAEENQAYSSGGAMHISAATLTFNGAAVFKKNKAGYDPSDPTTPSTGSGGALYFSGGTINFKETADFGGNTAGDGNTATTSGGALYAENSVNISFEKIVNFQNNSVSAGNGGAAYLSDGTLNFKADTTFQSNKSTDGDGGGAIYADTSTTSIIFEGTTQFLNNTAANTDPTNGGYGGAMYLASVGNAGDRDPASTLVFGLNAKGKTVFSGNQGVQGGAIYSDNSVMQFQELEFTNNTAAFTNPDPADPDSDGGGGALHANSSYIIFNGPTTVTGNKAANGSGGAFFVTQGTVDVDNPEYNLVFKNLTTISNNEAKNGGAFFLNNSAAVSFEGTTKITGNKAVNGGAFWLKGSMVAFSGNAEIADNTGTEKGGAFFVSGDSFIRVEDNSTLNIKAANGTAKNDIYLEDAAKLQLHTDGTKSSFTIASNISSDAAGTADIIKSGEGNVYIDGDASGFLGNLRIEAGELYIGNTGTFGDINSTVLDIETEGRLVLDVGKKTAESNTARISVDSMNLANDGTGPRIVAKALNDSDVSNPEKYEFITLNNDDGTTLQGYIDDGLIGSNFDFLDFKYEITPDSTNNNATLKVWVTYDPNTHDWKFDLPRAADEFTLNAQLNNSAKTLTVSGPGTLKLNNNNTVAGLSDSDEAGKSAGNLELLDGHSLTVAGDTDTSFSGTITGTTGKLIVNGELNQTLTGKNTYGGGTEVQNGTLTGNSDSLQGNINIGESGNVTFDQNTYSEPEGTFAGVLTGNGTLNIEGKIIEKGAQADSALRFTSNSSGFTGATNIKSGWLVLAKDGNQTGDLSGSDISISSTGGLGGTGTVNNVTVAPGGAVQAFEGTLKVKGNLEYTSGGILYVIVNPDAQGNAINVVDVAGTANLGNAQVKVVGVNESYTEGKDYTFLKTGEGLNGTRFSNSEDKFDDGTNNWTFKFAPSSDDKNYVAVGTKSDGPTPPDPPPPTPAGLLWNQGQVARALNTVGEGLTGFQNFVKELNTHKTTDADGNIEYDSVYRDITKQLAGSVRLNGLQLGLYSPYRTVFNRLTLGSELYSGSPIIYNNGSGYGPISGLEHRGAGAGAITYRGQYEPLNPHLMDETATCETPYFTGENNFWADVTHLQTKTKSDGNSDSYGISRTGFLIGMDIQRKPTSRIGLLFGYFAPYLWQNSDRVEADDYHTALYFQKNYHGTDIYGFLGYAHQEYKTQRFLDLTQVSPTYGIERYNGKTSGDTFSMSFELSKPRYYGNNYILRPFIGLDYIFTAQNGYLDYGTHSNLFGLRYDRAKYDQWFIRAGLNLKRETFRMATNFRIQYINQFAGHPYPDAGGQLISAYSTPNTNMNIRGVDLGRDYLNLGFGVNLFVNNARSRFLSFDYDFNTSRKTTAQGISLIFLEHF
ncbi:MAG: autotransporter domain-containing protein [Planctomycetaceae bacterium]|jgi:predicted outer membrane repeat protein|nr:autotransporter domain-containing protein [Planctomycetaceae bacterium]